MWRYPVHIICTTLYCFLFIPNIWFLVRPVADVIGKPEPNKPWKWEMLIFRHWPFLLPGSAVPALCLHWHPTILPVKPFPLSPFAYLPLPLRHVEALVSPWTGWWCAKDPGKTLTGGCCGTSLSGNLLESQFVYKMLHNALNICGIHTQTLYRREI